MFMMLIKYMHIVRKSSKVCSLDRLINPINQSSKEDWKKIIENYIKSRTYGTTNIIQNNKIFQTNKKINTFLEKKILVWED